jgi:hypothetical protein
MMQSLLRESFGGLLGALPAQQAMSKKRTFKALSLLKLKPFGQPRIGPTCYAGCWIAITAITNESP